eukprot:3111351-Amphidinium_carterae.2
MQSLGTRAQHVVALPEQWAICVPDRVGLYYTRLHGWSVLFCRNGFGSHCTARPLTFRYVCFKG